MSFSSIEETKPGRPFTITVSVKGPAVTNGDPIKAVIFAVDEGILRLTQFKTPNPVRALLGKQRLQLAYRDLYGRLISPLKGRPGIFQSGGDEAGNAGGIDKRVFKSVALTSGPISIGPNGKGEATLILPDFNGQLRLFAVAYSMGAVGGGKSTLLGPNVKIKSASLKIKTSTMGMGQKIMDFSPDASAAEMRLRARKKAKQARLTDTMEANRAQQAR